MAQAALTQTVTFWHVFQVAGYHEAEAACDYYYDEQGNLIGQSECYYTGRYR